MIVKLLGQKEVFWMENIDINLFLDKYCRILDCSGNLYIGQLSKSIFQEKNEDNELEDAIKIFHSNKWLSIFIDDIFLIEYYSKK